MGKDKSEKPRNQYWEGYEDGYTEGLAAGYEDGFNDEQVNRAVKSEGCEFCEDLEAGDYLYTYNEDEEGFFFEEFKAWFCPQCGKELPTGPRRDKGGRTA